MTKNLSLIFIVYFKFQALLSAIGGSLGLYLGISAAMMFEVVELFVDIIISFFLFCARPIGTVRA